MPNERRPLYSFAVGDVVLDTEGDKFEIVNFNRDEVTLLDSSGEHSYAHPLYPMEPWHDEGTNAPQT